MQKYILLLHLFYIMSALNEWFRLTTLYKLSERPWVPEVDKVCSIIKFWLKQSRTAIHLSISMVRYEIEM